MGGLPNFHAAFNSVMAKVAQRTGEQRSAAGGKQGHQKTPALIRALVLQALAQLAADAKAAEAGTATAAVQEEQPQGGFTDVGLHTGGRARDTAWPLVLAALKVRRGGGWLQGC